MTTVPAIESVVTVEHFDNVTFVRWHTPEPPARVVGEAPARRAPLSHRVRRHGLLVGLIVAGPLCMALQAMGVGR